MAQTEGRSVQQAFLLISILFQENAGKRNSIPMQDESFMADPVTRRDENEAALRAAWT
jgi:hypothetical protein